MTEAPVTILITSAGGASACNVIKALKSQAEIPVRLIASDLDPLGVGLHLADVAYTLPRASDKAFIPKVLEICEKEGVEVIIPILSVEVPVFAEHLAEFQARRISLVLPSSETLSICGDKWKTYQRFIDAGIPTPRSWRPDELPDAAHLPFPLFIKPSVGSGSRDAYRVDSSEDLHRLLSTVKNPIIQEFVSGAEYTVDVFADRESNLLAAIPRERMRVAEGKTQLGRTLMDPEIRAFVERIVKQVSLVGPGNVQCIRGEQGLRFTEINARFAAGGLPLAIAAGANTPLMLLKLALGRAVEPIHGYQVGLVMARYSTEIFFRVASDGTVQEVGGHA
jgi:carbamoyl-phosphate synthase large subunit